MGVDEGGGGVGGEGGRRRRAHVLLLLGLSLWGGSLGLDQVAASGCL